MRRNTKIYTQLVLSMLIPLISYAVLLSSPFKRTISAPAEHFYIVSLVSILAILLSVAVGFVGLELRNIKISFLSLAYISLAMLFSMHGLSTPGFLTDNFNVTGHSAQLSILVAVVWLWLSSLSVDHPIIHWFAKRQRILVPVWMLILGAICAVIWMFPDISHYLHSNQEFTKWLATIFIIGLNSWTMARYLQTYLSSRFPLQLAMVHSIGWMTIAQFIIATGQVWELSWWLYHYLLLASVIIMVSGIVSQYVSSKSIRSSVKLMFRSDPSDWIRAYMSTSVKELVKTTETRDHYTAGHNYRVALYALKLGEELNLSSDELRAIAQGCLVHDVGKLRIPDHILNKPGKLTSDERKIIELHPSSGYDLCKRLGFMPEELSVIRSHHEKWDGTGYPDQLKGEDIPLIARVTAIADVYDALTSSRSYRKAMTHEAAMEIIQSESGRHFDPHCIEAWKRLVKEQPVFFEETVRNSPHLNFAKV